MVSALVPDVASNKQNVLIRLGFGEGRVLTQPLWQGVSLVVDEFSRAAFGEVIIHAILLANFAITRKAQWQQTDKRNTPRPMEKLHCPVESRESLPAAPCCTACCFKKEERSVRASRSFRSGQSLVWASDGVAIRAKHLGAEDSTRNSNTRSGG